MSPARYQEAVPSGLLPAWWLCCGTGTGSPEGPAGPCCVLACLWLAPRPAREPGTLYPTKLQTATHPEGEGGGRAGGASPVHSAGREVPRVGPVPAADPDPRVLQLGFACVWLFVGPAPPRDIFLVFPRVLDPWPPLLIPHLPYLFHSSYIHTLVELAHAGPCDSL